MQFPAQDYRLDHFASRPFNYDVDYMLAWHKTYFIGLCTRLDDVALSTGLLQTGWDSHKLKLRNWHRLQDKMETGNIYVRPVETDRAVRDRWRLVSVHLTQSLSVSTGLAWSLPVSVGLMRLCGTWELIRGWQKLQVTGETARDHWRLTETRD